MRVHFAVSPSQKWIDLLGQNGVENVLVSFAFIKKAQSLKNLFRDYQPKNLILDSGAFSVWAAGKYIDIDEYAQFCKGVKLLLPDINIYCVNLDVLPGKFGERPTQAQREESVIQGWNNMLYLEERGLKVIHVFHQHESFETLERLMAHSDYIGISPANDVSMNEKLNWLNQVFKITRDKVKCHGFAVTSHKQLYKYPFFSVDSSSWTAPARFGRIPVFMDDLTITSFEYKDREGVEKIWKYISSIGIEKLGSKDFDNRINMSIRSFLKLQAIATKLWADRGVIWEAERGNILTVDN